MAAVVVIQMETLPYLDQGKPALEKPECAEFCITWVSAELKSKEASNILCLNLASSSAWFK